MLVEPCDEEELETLCTGINFQFKSILQNMTHALLQCLNHSLYEFIEQEDCPETCMCQSAPRDYPGRRNLQGSGVAKGYCFYYCDTEGYCGVSQEAKAQGLNCKLCRMKFYGY